MRIYFVLLLFLVRIQAKDGSQCERLEKKFTKELNSAKQPVCICAENGIFHTSDGLSIECESASASTITDNLIALNGTSLGRFIVRDSTLNVLPVTAFETVIPRVIRVERCGITELPIETFTPALVDVVELVSFRENRLKTIRTGQFGVLNKVKIIDMSLNKITDVEKNAFKGLSSVEELMMNGNDLNVITAGMFDGLKNVRRLNLGDSGIRSIEKGAFRGMNDLEQLILTDNMIEELDWSMFNTLKNLKYIELSNNRLSNIELKSLPKLEKLVLNNNNFETMKQIKLKDLPSLSVAMFDRNSIRTVGDMDMVGLIKSEKIATVSFAYNNISTFSGKAFQHIPNLINLLLSNNQLTELSNNLIPYLAPLKRLLTLQISMNNLTTIRAGELPKSLLSLALDHNAIENIAPRALEGIELKRLYLNSNKLQFLYNGAFDSIPPTSIEAIDVSHNSWQCVCKDPKEWLPRWLSEAEDSDVSEGPIGCLAIPGCGMPGEPRDFDEEEETVRAGWITVAATILTVITIVIMISIAMIYFKDLKNQFPLRGRRSNSDLHKLIENDPLNLPSESILVIPAMPKRNGGPKKTVRFDENY